MFKIKNRIKKLLPKYELYRVYNIPLNYQIIDIKTNLIFVNLALTDYSNHALYKNTAGYKNTESYGFGLLKDEKLVAIQWYWFGQRSKELDWWSMPDDSIMSMHIQVDTCYQNRGLSTVLKSFALKELSEAGFKNVYSRVWHNHLASIAMNRRLGAIQEGWQGKIGSKKFKFKNSRK
ncbi:hypothetical protein [Colwellia ponticola]|uniref:Uncharacterized protein n=1 Tax=Colwellia ponticola TaxID=2304625 RepID=A0A8H2PK34_9GAMM|nr:hypothetical protein [Colwellia ponticola]TMM45276.1 hypothetical protein FCS21_09295 [Colwellia ponticola]